jgi:hypothetical protein
VKNTRNQSRWRDLLAGLVVGLGLAAPATVLAQNQPAMADVARLPEKSFMSKSAFNLPIKLDEKARPSIREVQLYVKEGPTARWVLKDSVPPSQTNFNCRLTQDGEYWFAVVTVDLAGKATPADVSKEPPGIIVVLDTQGPQVELKALAPNPEGICVQCDVKDANPNPFLTKFEYQTGDRTWRPLEPMGSQAECFCIPRQAVLTGMCRVSCTDRASNTTVREFSLASIGLSPEGSVVVRQDAPKGLTAGPEKTASPVQQTQYTQPVEPVKDVIIDKGMTPTAHHLNEAPAVGLVQSPAPVPAKQETATAHSETARLSGTWHLINNRHLSLEYRIQDEGTSGVGKVEVWVTRDGGATWDSLCCDPRHKSPIEFDLPGEGRFGLRLVTTNGLGFGDGPPKRGDAPEYMVEVDTTKPQAEFVEAKLAPIAENPYVDISWKASDENFGAEPIDLFYSTTPQGPWTPIVKGWQNSGRFRWFLPRGVGREAYLRMVATDLAGNSARCDLGTAVSLDDNSRPSARIIGVGTTPAATPPVGN